MDIQGVAIGPDIRLLATDDATAWLYHRIDGDEWCATALERSMFVGSWEAGNFAYPERFDDSTPALLCSGGHIAGRVVEGQWRGVPFVETDGEAV